MRVQHNNPEAETLNGRRSKIPLFTAVLQKFNAQAKKNDCNVMIVFFTLQRFAAGC